MPRAGTYRGFKQFVNNQPENKAIDHRHGWCGCAIGEYMGYSDADYSGDGNDPSDNENEMNYWTVQHLPHAVRQDLSSPFNGKNTYGDLNFFLKGHG